MFKRGSTVRELLETALLTLLIFLVVKGALQNFRVEGQSMEPNLHNGEYILVNKVDYLLHPPQRGDIVVFRAVAANQPDKDFIKRVVGLPGDTVSIRGQSLLINGHVLSEPYRHLPFNYSFGPRKVPPNDYFVLGDHRNDSDDSHMWASTWLRRTDIIGKAWIAYWPPKDIEVLQAHPRVAMGL